MSRRLSICLVRTIDLPPHFTHWLGITFGRESGQEISLSFPRRRTFISPSIIIMLSLSAGLCAWPICCYSFMQDRSVIGLRRYWHSLHACMHLRSVRRWTIGLHVGLRQQNATALQIISLLVCFNVERQSNSQQLLSSHSQSMRSKVGRDSKSKLKFKILHSVIAHYATKLMWTYLTRKAVVARRYLRQGKAIRQMASPSSLCQRFPYSPFNDMITKI